MRRQATEVNGVHLEYSGEWYVAGIEQLIKQEKYKLNKEKKE